LAVIAVGRAVVRIVGIAVGRCVRTVVTAIRSFTIVVIIVVFGRVTVAADVMQQRTHTGANAALLCTAMEGSEYTLRRECVHARGVGRIKMWRTYARNSIA
jgi:hypothetical protein